MLLFGICERFVSTFARILFDEVNAFVNHRAASPSKRNEEIVNQTKD